MLREFARSLPVPADAVDFRAEVKEAMDDMLLPQIEEMQKMVRKRLVKHLTGESISFAAGAIVGFVSTSDLLASTGAGAATMAIGILGKTLFDKEEERAARRTVLALTTNSRSRHALY
jgi:hypothetical protein